MGGFFSGLGAWILGGLAAIAIVVAGYFLFRPAAPPEAPPEAVAVAPETAAPPQAAPQPEPVEEESETETVEEPEIEADAGDESAPEPLPEVEAPAPLEPDFDVVRIRPDGDALVAGRAEPGAQITVLVEGEAVAEAMADAGASFVAMFVLPPSEADRVMLLEATLEDGRRLASPRSVIVEGVVLPPVVADAAPEVPPAPPVLPGPQADDPAQPPAAVQPAGETGETRPELPPAPIVSAEGQSAPQMQGEPVPEATVEPESAPVAQPPTAESAPDTVATTESVPPPPAPAEPAPSPAAPRVLLAGPEGITVLQDPGPAPPLSIDTISYDAGGEVSLAGRGAGEETLRIYLDNAPVRSARVGPDGQWRVPLPGVDTGVYTLRVDSIAPDGAVSSRVETPFKREEPEVLAAAEQQAAEAVAAGRSISAVTIQPGHTLWAIAKDRYGEGIQYVRIFRANRDLIRDPDWIYPGQVFTLPDTQ